MHLCIFFVKFLRKHSISISHIFLSSNSVVRDKLSKVMIQSLHKGNPTQSKVNNNRLV